MNNVNEEQLLTKVKKLKKDYKYSLARNEILSQYSNKFENIKQPKLLRELAQCFYKDLELHKDFSYKKALKILKSIHNDDDIKETLCLKGAVYKRKWEHKANLEYLYEAIKSYKSAYKNHKNKDRGYGGINASYLYDVLSNELKNIDVKYSKKLSKKADDLRSDIIESFQNEEKDEWLYHILAQAYFGNKDFDNCKKTLEESTKYDYEDWEIFTTYKQLYLLSKLKNIEDLTCLLPLLGEDCTHILEQSLDKKGLALSGGGFRASFFQLGTLAKLAECDMLKDIEVLSTVSGGSIIGVLYYLKLQKLLENNTDHEIVKEHYINLVHELINEFFEGVQTDIRNSVIKSDIGKTFKYLNPFSDYSRTNRLGELYQERLYKKYQNHMKDLIITPKEWENEQEKFKPRFNNWRRKNKVPILVINTTNLNSGHNWQFQASKMGEPEYMSDLEIDKNDRFDWIRYDDKGLQEKFQNYPIGQAVACSSAVPVLFTPIVLKDLYEDYTLSISDGGVYDNQGFSGLLSEECDYIICSDASGQMDNQKSFSTTMLGTNIRTVDIQMDRNRELIFEDLKHRKEKGILKGFLFTHLKENIKSNVVKQKDVVQKFEDNDEKTFQDAISNVRTDLDIFSKTEAYTLMYNGYALFEKRVKKEKIKYTVDNDWVFLSVKNDIENKSKKLMRELKLSQYKFGRWFRKWWRR